jgi:hypothetical protein
MWRIPPCVLFALLVVGPVALGQTAANPAEADDGKPTRLDADPSLAGWWKFEETSGKTAVDSSKHGRNGTLVGGLSFDTDSVPGRVGSALKLDGQKGFVQITGYKGVTGTRPRTLAVWVKTTTPQGEIMSWGLDDFGKMWKLCFIRSGIGVTPSGGYLYIDARVHDDIWHQMVVVVEEADLPNLHDDVRLYKDGVLQDIDDIGLLDLWPIETGNEVDVRIGRRFTGLIDDVRIYSRALATEEIKALFGQR